MKTLKRTLQIGKATIKIEMNYYYDTVDLDGHVSTSKRIVKLVNAELWADNKLIQESRDSLIYLSDGKTRFNNIYITEQTGIKIIEAIGEMHIELSKSFTLDTTTQEIEEIDEAKKIMAEVEKRKTPILSSEEETKWRINYNNINNEGGEGYIPNRITIEDIERAKLIIEKGDVKNEY